MPMLSAKSQYASLAMAQLAADYPDQRPVQAAKIAASHDIPSTFLVQILHELKRAGLVTSTRGASGGYRLSRPPEATTLGEVVEVFEPADIPAECAAKGSPLAEALTGLCRELAEARRQRLDRVTLADLARALTEHAAPMWYI